MLEKRKLGISRDFPKFKYPLLSQEQCKDMDFKFGHYIHKVHPNKREKGAWTSRDCPILKVPYYLSGTGKAMNFRFCTHIHRLDRNKSPLKIWRKVAVGILRHSQKFSEHLCDSSAFLLLIHTVFSITRLKY